ncbi:MAG: hypothetical protein H7222_17810 [Methylotenera sp.]|nr:hypothetical protein [Oligoflexia bacterium]
MKSSGFRQIRRRFHAVFIGFITLYGVVGVLSDCAFAAGLQHAQIYQAKLGPVLKRMGEIIGGTLLIDRLHDEISLTLLQKRTCSESVLCFQDVPIAFETVLPVRSVTRDACGIITLEAWRESGAFDGGSQRLLVRDSSKRVCKINVPVATEIDYDTVTLTGAEHSSFKAFALVPHP